MAKILLSYGVNREQTLTAKIALETKKTLEKQGHVVVLKKCPENSHSFLLKLARVYALMKAIEPSVNPAWKKTPVVSAIPDDLAFLANSARSRLHSRVSPEEIEAIHSQLVALMHPSSSPLGKKLAKQLSSLIEKNMQATWAFDAVPLLKIFREKQFAYHSQLASKFPDHHVFDFNSPPLFELFASAKEKNFIAGFGLPKEEHEKLKPVLLKAKTAVERRALKSFKPTSKHLAGELMRDSKAVLPVRALFFHHSRWPLLGAEDFYSYHGKPEKSFVSIVFPAITRLSKGTIRKIAKNKKWVYQHAQINDVQASEKAGLTRDLANQISIGITRVIKNQVRVKRKI